MQLKRSLVVLSLVALAFGAPKRALDSRHKVKELVRAPRGWVQGAPAPADHVIKLKIALPQSNFPELERHLYEVSDPSHARYGQHLSKEEVEELVAPHPESVDVVDAWLSSFGLGESDSERSPAKDWVTLRVPVKLAETMLDTKYHVWTHESSGDTVVRTLTYGIPEDVFDHIELVQPTTMFARMKSHKTTFRFSPIQPAVEGTPATTSSSGSPLVGPGGSQVDASCNDVITLSCLQQLYNSVGVKGSGKDGNQIAVTAYLGQFANLADLKLFFEDQNPAAASSSFKFVSVNDGQNSQNVTLAGVEANLDTQFAFGLTFPTPATFFSTAGMPPFIPDRKTDTDSNEPYTTWLDFVLAQKTLPQTISTSYGDDEQTVPDSFALRSCQGFAQLGARGVTLLFSSGDGGVGDNDPNPATQICITNDGTNKTEFLPTFPATCPFVTGVGGTTSVPEVAVDFSAGGFSNLFSRPSYQDAAVLGFLRQLPKGKFEGLFNPNGRGFPDVAAQGANFRIFFEGGPGLVDGTSCAAPTFAGFVSLLNDVRLEHGKAPLGFLNPFLYSTGFAGLNDITAGNNPGCGTEGFNATKGWDPVTGLGTPNFGILKNLVLQA